MQEYSWVFFFYLIWFCSVRTDRWESHSQSVSLALKQQQTFEFLEDAPFFLLCLPDFKVFRLLWNIDNRYSWLRHGWSFRKRFLTGNFQKEVLHWGEQQALADFQTFWQGLSEGHSSLERTSEIGGVSEGGLKILDISFFSTSAIEMSSTGAKFALLVSRISWGYLSLIFVSMLWTMSSLMEQEKIAWLSTAVRVLLTWSKVAFVTLKEIMLRFWEALFNRGRGGSSKKPCRTQGTTCITSSCAVSSLVLCASWCFSFWNKRIWM